LGCGRRIVVAVLHADVGELAVGLDRVLEALRARSVVEMPDRRS
jgi:hypothetical protein